MTKQSTRKNYPDNHQKYANEDDVKTKNEPHQYPA